MMLLSNTIVDFHLFYDGAVDIQIWALLTRSQCKVSDTQVTVKACWPLVIFLLWSKALIYLSVFEKSKTHSSSPVTPSGSLLIYPVPLCLSCKIWRDLKKLGLVLLWHHQVSFLFKDPKLQVVHEKHVDINRYVLWTTLFPSEMYC